MNCSISICRRSIRGLNSSVMRTCFWYPRRSRRRSLPLQGFVLFLTDAFINDQASNELPPAALRVCRCRENPASVSESDTQPTEAPDQADYSTAVLPQSSEPGKKTDESERRPETAASTAPPETEPPAPPATEAPKPAEQPQPTEPPTQEPTAPAFDISYWISFAKSYAESVGLTLNSEAVYCWDNPIDADAGCIYLERDIQSRTNLPDHGIHSRSNARNSLQ